MMAGWMVYAILVAALVALAAAALEAGVRALGRPTRWIWALALLASALLPLSAFLRPAGEARAPVPAWVLEVPTTSPFGESRLLDSGSGAAWGVPETAWARRGLMLLWLVSGVGVTLLVAVSHRRVARLRRAWRRRRVSGRPVWVSPNLGPAVVGVRTPSIVVPRWLLAWERRALELVLAHEEQHLWARDTHLLAGGLALVALAPWNLPLWWLLRRLRLAVEMDCDRRVLDLGTPPLEYGRMLVEMGRMKAGLGLSAAAVAEPASMLERRLKAMTKGKVGRRIWTAMAGLVAAGVVGVVACEVPPPTRVAGDVPQADAALASSGAMFTPRSTTGALLMELRELERRAETGKGERTREDLEASMVKLRRALEEKERQFHEQSGNQVRFGPAEPDVLEPEIRIGPDGALSVGGQEVDVARVVRELERAVEPFDHALAVPVMVDEDAEPGRVKRVFEAVAAVEGVKAWMVGARVKRPTGKAGEGIHAEGARREAVVMFPNGDGQGSGDRPEPAIMIDGVEVDRARLDELDPDLIERIDVVKGDAARDAGYENGLIKIQLKSDAKKGPS